MDKNETLLEENFLMEEATTVESYTSMEEYLFLKKMRIARFFRLLWSDTRYYLSLAVRAALHIFGSEQLIKSLFLKFGERFAFSIPSKFYNKKFFAWILAEDSNAARYIPGVNVNNWLLDYVEQNYQKHQLVTLLCKLAFRNKVYTQKNWREWEDEKITSVITQFVREKYPKYLGYIDSDLILDYDSTPLCLDWKKGEWWNGYVCFVFWKLEELDDSWVKPDFPVFESQV